MKNWTVSLGLMAAFTAVAGASQAQQVAFNAPSGTSGNQNFGGSLGIDFSVASSVTNLQVQSLGYFNGGNDASRPSGAVLAAGTTITVELFSLSNTSTPLATETFTQGTPGTLASGSSYRFSNLGSGPLSLSAGFQGAIVAYGFNGFDQDYDPDPSSHTIVTDPSGDLSFTGMYYNGGGGTSFPTSLDPAGLPYGAGSFQFTNTIVTPEPGSYTMALSMASVGGAFLLRRRRNRKK